MDPVPPLPEWDVLRDASGRLYQSAQNIANAFQGSASIPADLQTLSTQLGRLENQPTNLILQQQAQDTQAALGQLQQQSQDTQAALGQLQQQSQDTQAALAQLGAQMTAMQANMNSRFDNIDSRFDKVEASVAALYVLHGLCGSLLLSDADIYL
jgi:chromosome segregation ATPase